MPYHTGFCQLENQSGEVVVLDSAVKVEFKSFRHNNPSGTTESHIVSYFVAYDVADPCRSIIHGAYGHDALEFDSCGCATG